MTLTSEVFLMSRETTLGQHAKQQDISISHNIEILSKEPPISCSTTLNPSDFLRIIQLDYSEYSGRSQHNQITLLLELDSSDSQND